MSDYWFSLLTPLKKFDHDTQSHTPRYFLLYKNRNVILKVFCISLCVCAKAPEKTHIFVVSCFAKYETIWVQKFKSEWKQNSTSVFSKFCKTVMKIIVKHKKILFVKYDNFSPKPYVFSLKTFLAIYMSQGIPGIRHFRKCLGNSGNLIF